jgi:hypothetical protein
MKHSTLSWIKLLRRLSLCMIMCLILQEDSSQKHSTRAGFNKSWAPNSNDIKNFHFGTLYILQYSRFSLYSYMKHFQIEEYYPLGCDAI